SKGDVAGHGAFSATRFRSSGVRKGAIVGSDYETFTILSGRDLGVTALARVRVRLPGGTLRVRGRVSANSLSGTFAVLGGTGGFAEAPGTQYVRDLNRDGTRSVNVYHLRLP